jgi:hypothetical protein
MVCYKDALYIYGGSVKGRFFNEDTNEHWKFNITTTEWSLLIPSKYDVESPPASSKHSFHLDQERGIYYMMVQLTRTTLVVYGYNIERGIWYRTVSLPSPTDYDMLYSGFIATLPGTNKITFSYSIGYSYFHVIYDLGTLDSVFRLDNIIFDSKLHLLRFWNI